MQFDYEARVVFRAVGPGSGPLPVPPPKPSRKSFRGLDDKRRSSRRKWASCPSDSVSGPCSGPVRKRWGRYAPCAWPRPFPRRKSAGRRAGTCDRAPFLDRGGPRGLQARRQRRLSSIARVRPKDRGSRKDAPLGVEQAFDLSNEDWRRQDNRERKALEAIFEGGRAA